MASNSWFIPFVIGGVSASASACIVHPLDVIKCQLQLASKQNSTKPESNSAPSASVISILKSTGVRALYAGYEIGFPQMFM